MYQNPYLNPYQMTPKLAQNMPSPAQQQVVKVNGRNGAEMYQMAANSSVLLLDESAPIVWLATTDGAGYKSLTAYDIAPHQEQPPVDIKNIEERLSRLEEAMKHGNESNSSSSKRKLIDAE